MVSFETGENVVEIILERVTELHDCIKSYWIAYVKWECPWYGNSILISLLQNKKKKQVEWGEKKENKKKKM